jgi:hypothetical protein
MMAMCDARFHLTQDTPFMQEPLWSELGPLAVHAQVASDITERRIHQGFPRDGYVMLPTNPTRQPNFL